MATPKRPNKEGVFWFEDALNQKALWAAAYKVAAGERVLVAARSRRVAERAAHMIAARAAKIAARKEEGDFLTMPWGERVRLFPGGPPGGRRGHPEERPQDQVPLRPLPLPQGKAQRPDPRLLRLLTLSSARRPTETLHFYVSSERARAFGPASSFPAAGKPGTGCIGLRGRPWDRGKVMRGKARDPRPQGVWGLCGGSPASRVEARPPSSPGPTLPWEGVPGRLEGPWKAGEGVGGYSPLAPPRGRPSGAPRSRERGPRGAPRGEGARGRRRTASPKSLPRLTTLADREGQSNARRSL